MMGCFQVENGYMSGARNTDDASVQVTCLSCFYDQLFIDDGPSLRIIAVARRRSECLK